MYRVLLPVDADEHRTSEQLETLLALPADPDDLSVTVLHVLEEIDTASDEAGTMVIEDLNESLSELRDVPETVTQVEDRLEAAGIETTRETMVGDPVDGILQVADGIDADAILLGGRKRSPVGKAIFGSISQNVIVETERTVVLAD
jgi:nucleotide-binding universal stress UspA family protein